MPLKKSFGRVIVKRQKMRKEERKMEQERDLQYLLLRIKNKYDSLPHALRKIADFLLVHHSDAAYMGITELSSVITNIFSSSRL